MNENVKAALARLPSLIGCGLRPISHEDPIGQDGFPMCKLCGEPLMQSRNLPVLGPSSVRRACACEREAASKADAMAKMEAQKRALEALRSASMLDARLRECRFETSKENPDDARIMKIARNYAAKFPEMLKRGQGLLLYGNVGTGKTHAAACIANDLMERQLRSVLVTSTVRLVAAAQAMKMGEGEETLLAQLARPQLLILDDLGAERDTAYAEERVYGVLEARLASGKPMIITTNLSLEEMQTESRTIFRRLYDRIFQCCFPVEFKGKAWRKAEAASRYQSMKAMLEGD